MAVKTKALSVLVAIVTIATSMAGVGAAIAATDGTLGATSTGRANLTVTVSREMRVSNLNDLALGTYDPAAAPLTGIETLCVFDNATTGYQVTLSSANGAGAFEMHNGTSVVVYNVDYDDSGLGTNFVAATEGVPLTGRTNADTVNDTCITRGSDNARIRIRVFNTGVTGVDTNGTHNDTLTVLIAPTP